MFISALRGASIVRAICWSALAALFAVLTGCASPYVDGAVKDVPNASFTKPAQLQPVQVVVEFQTNGTPNARATEFVKPMVMERIKAAGIFSDVQDKPNGGALLSVKINNVALLDEAYKKGFLTGLTFGAAGSTVTDGYLCTVSYTSREQATPIVKTAKHAIHTALGSGTPPAGAVKAANLQEAVTVMARQIVGVAMKELSDDPSFK